MSNDIQRRDFLKRTLRTTGAGVSAAALSGSLAPELLGALAPSYKTKHVVLIGFSGGVRSRETFGTPDNVPNLMRIANRGVVLPNCKANNLGHYGASLSIFTGNSEVFGIRENSRSVNPTIFEYLRKDLNLPANKVWLSSSSGDQLVNFSHGTHPKYGGRYAANLLSAEGVFNAEFKEILDAFGRPRVPSDQESALMEGLRGVIDTNSGIDVEAANRREVEKFILGEITGKTTNLTGPGAQDAKAIRIATNILRVFRPTLLGISLNQHDVAHGSYNGYVEIIRRNDSEIGGLLDSIDQDPELRDSTAVLVVPEFGRNRDLNERNGLDHGDGSEDLGKVALFASGPDFRQGKVLKDNIATVDICPTLCKILGAKAEYASGRVIRKLIA